MQGHVKAVLSLDFSSCGYLLATGSEDNTARVWDLRKRQVLSTLPGEYAWCFREGPFHAGARHGLQAGWVFPSATRSRKCVH